MVAENRSGPVSCSELPTRSAEGREGDAGVLEFMRFDGAIVRPVVWPVILALLWFGADLLGITEHIVRSVAAMSQQDRYELLRWLGSSRCRQPRA